MVGRPTLVPLLIGRRRPLYRLRLLLRCPLLAGLLLADLTPPRLAYVACSLRALCSRRLAFPWCASYSLRLCPVLMSPLFAYSLRRHRHG